MRSSNTTGNDNTASGLQALSSQHDRQQQHRLRGQALLSNTTGNDNTASGYQALFSNTTGNDNTASGVEAL